MKIHRSCALQFVLQNATKIYRKHRVETVPLHTGMETLEMDLYRPPSGRKSRGTILSIHGMTVKGKNDPRMVNVSRSLAGAGFTVCSPTIPGISDLKISHKDVPQMVRVIRAIASDVSLTPDGQLGLFAPSFTAGIALIASTRPGAREHISSICTVGTMGQVESTIRFLLEQTGIDDYGTLIVLSNFIHHSTGKKPNLTSAFREAAIDNGLFRNPPQLHEIYVKMSEEEIELFEKLKSSSRERLTHWERIEPKLEFMRSNLDVLQSLHEISARVTLIHGRDDRVIPPSESILIYNKLQSLKGDVRLCITRLISHGDTTYGLDLFQELWRLTSAFGHFFAGVMERKTSQFTAASEKKRNTNNGIQVRSQKVPGSAAQSQRGSGVSSSL